MTIETTANRISYTGSGTTGPFSFPYYFLADGDLTVIKTTIADGTEETLTLTTDYTVSGAGEAAGGSVTLVATLSSAYKLTIIRDPDILQPADYPANDRFPAATHEEALDRATMILQRLKDLIDRSFRLSDGDVSGISLILQNLGAGKLIAVNSAGTGIESIAAADVDLATVSAFIQTLFDDADAATARTTLGAAATGANIFTGLQTFAAGADIASATTVDLTAATGNLVRITGTTATTGVTINNGQVVICYPTGAWPLTYHATNMPIKGGESVTVAAGGTVIFSKDGNGTLHVDIFKADGTAVVANTSGVYGQCRLAMSGSNLKLSPFGGNLLTINGVACTIPDAGVELVPTGTADDTFYIYAYMNAGTMTLEASTTAHATSTTAGNKGNEIKSGDNTRTLVGMAYNASDTWSTTRSWHNRRSISARSWLTADRTTTSTTIAEIHTEARVYFLTWADEAVQANANGFASNSAAYQQTQMAIGWDGVAVYGGVSKQANTTATSVNSLSATSVAAAGQLTERALHYCVLGGAVSANTGTFYGGADNAARTEMNVITRG